MLREMFEPYCPRVMNKGGSNVLPVLEWALIKCTLSMRTQPYHDNHQNEHPVFLRYAHPVGATNMMRRWMARKTGSR